MNEIVVTNNDEINIKSIFKELGDKADRIKVASAFFSDTDFIINWLENSKIVDLIISLRPPTNYDSLKSIYSKFNLNIQFLGKNFHSKFYIFYKDLIPFACIIGSSNFTSGGLHSNIETNAILFDKKYLEEIDRHFNNIWEKSFLLQPSDLDDFKEVFDNFKKREEINKIELDDFQKKIISDRNVALNKRKIGKEAKEYLTFWRIVDEVKEIVKDISEKEYPEIPVYLTIDHFWHWIKTVWSKDKITESSILYQKSKIQQLFIEYCYWDKNGDNYTTQMAENSRKIFSNLLSEKNINNLTKEEAKIVYKNLHSGGMRARRFGSDKLFVDDNSIDRIRYSLKYLLYSNDDICLRIHNLCNNQAYKLKEFSKSTSQELIGWVNPEKYPIRNDKADYAVKLLGYEF